MTHTIQFDKNQRTGLAVAYCTCGWYMTGTLRDLQARAATHDLDQEDEHGDETNNNE